MGAKTGGTRGIGAEQVLREQERLALNRGEPSLHGHVFPVKVGGVLDRGLGLAHSHPLQWQLHVTDPCDHPSWAFS